MALGSLPGFSSCMLECKPRTVQAQSYGAFPSSSAGCVHLNKPDEAWSSVSLSRLSVVSFLHDFVAATTERQRGVHDIIIFSSCDTCPYRVFQPKPKTPRQNTTGVKGRGVKVYRGLCLCALFVDGLVCAVSWNGGLLEGYRINRVVWEGVYIHTGLASTCRGKCSC